MRLCWLAQLAEEEAVSLPPSHIWLAGILQHPLQTLQYFIHTP